MTGHVAWLHERNQRVRVQGKMSGYSRRSRTDRTVGNNYETWQTGCPACSACPQTARLPAGRPVRNSENSWRYCRTSPGRNIADTRQTNHPICSCSDLVGIDGAPSRDTRLSLYPGLIRQIGVLQVHRNNGVTHSSSSFGPALRLVRNPASPSWSRSRCSSAPGRAGAGSSTRRPP